MFVVFVDTQYDPRMQARRVKAVFEKWYWTVDC
jgi:hypothetical protein